MPRPSVPCRSRVFRTLALGTSLLAAAVLTFPARAADAARDRITLVPHIIGALRVPGRVPGHLLIHNGSADGASVTIEEILVTVDGEPLARVEVRSDLTADSEYPELAALVERLPVEFTERHGRRSFATPTARELVESEIPAAWQEIATRLAAIRKRVAETGTMPFLEISVELPLDRVFADRAPGSIVAVDFAVRYRLAARPGISGTGPQRPVEQQTQRISVPIRYLPPFRGVPDPLRSELGGALAVHAGDLHVHSCHGESLGACSPSGNCYAESLQVSGSFSFAELKSQYQALGIDWFTATDHSYCINSDGEYDAIAAEVAAITDVGFVAIPDTEVSSDETGPQTGGDLGDILCFGLTSANHMGAHGIDSRIFGGDDDLLGFCDGFFSDALESFHHNVEEIRAEGGYPIVNHPAADSWGWNSLAEARGIEANALHGVEIWNGGTTSGQGGDVASWVEWLLSGRILYAYSGSDTHDEAFDFGANRVLMTAPLTAPNLEAALMAGRSFISNGDFLALTARAGRRTLRMGDLQPLPSALPPGTPITLRTHYDVGPEPTTITVFRGRIGDAAETIVCTRAVTGAGVLSCADEVATDASSYYRSYSEENAGDRVAYTNPIFLRR